MEIKFSNWKKWNNRNNLDGLEFPGVYCLSISDLNLSNKEFDWSRDIKYVGMTNSRNGLRGRLKQFDNTINGKRGHGGADRFRYKHEDYNKLTQNLYVAVQSFKCDVKSNKPNDLIIMGEVAKHEYVCFSEYVKLFNELPEFNNKKDSPKYSLTKGRKN